MTIRYALLMTVLLVGMHGQSAPSNSDSAYVLGPDDTIAIQAANVPEIGATPFVIDPSGDVNVPRVGRIHAAGLTTQQLEKLIVEKLQEYLQEPSVTVSVGESRSQPVSVLGAVGSPGVHQIRGRKTLFELLSEVGGLRVDAGNDIRITRRREWGPIPLPSAAPDATNEFSVATVNVKAVMEASNPEENILIKPNDVISVPRADFVYVIGAVKKAGGFMLAERQNVSVLSAIAMAEGMDRFASAKSAKILRVTPGNASRTEIPIDLKKILSSKANDIQLLAEDILFVPTNATRSLAVRTLESAAQMGAIYAIR